MEQLKRLLYKDKDCHLWQSLLYHFAFNAQSSTFVTHFLHYSIFMPHTGFVAVVLFCLFCYMHFFQFCNPNPTALFIGTPYCPVKLWSSPLRSPNSLPSAESCRGNLPRPQNGKRWSYTIWFFLLPGMPALPDPWQCPFLSSWPVAGSYLLWDYLIPSLSQPPNLDPSLPGLLCWWGKEFPHSPSPCLSSVSPPTPQPASNWLSLGVSWSCSDSSIAQSSPKPSLPGRLPSRTVMSHPRSITRKGVSYG